MNLTIFCFVFRITEQGVHVGAVMEFVATVVYSCGVQIVIQVWPPLHPFSFAFTLPPFLSPPDTRYHVPGAWCLVAGAWGL